MLYTGNGDGGDTSLFGSTKRVLKSDARIRALGALDSLNAYVGVIKTGVKGEWYAALERLQQVLFIAQAEVGGADKHISQKELAVLEDEIAGIERELPPITTFLLSGGTRVAAELDYARTLARVLECELVALHRTAPLGADLLAYTNRLSSYLFALSRKYNHEAGVGEQTPTYGD